MKHVAVFFITLYQRYVSQHKGFRCAYASLYGGDSCSQAVKMLILAHGCLASYSLIKARFAACRQARQSLLYHQQNQGNDKKSCDMPDDCPSDCCEDDGCNTHACNDTHINCELPHCDLPCDVPCDCCAF